MMTSIKIKFENELWLSEESSLGLAIFVLSENGHFVDPSFNQEFHFLWSMDVKEFDC